MDLVLNHTSDRHPWFQESKNRRINRTGIIISGGILKKMEHRPTTGFPFLADQAGNLMKRTGHIISINFSKNSLM
jgi:hypothetical protein